MSNLEKSSRLLQDWADMHSLDVDMYHAARKLLEAGLLAPDLPEPDVVKLNGDVKYLICDAAQVRQDAESGRVQVYSKYLLTTIEARRLALALLAACEYAEKEQGNE